LELILVQYSPHLKKVLDIVDFSSARRQAARLIQTLFTEHKTLSELTSV